MAQQPAPGFGGTTKTQTMGAPQEASSNVTPEEQKQYDLFVSQCLDLISNNEKVRAAVIEMMKSAPEPNEGLAQAAAFIVMRVEDAAAEKGIKFSGDILLHGGMEVLEAIADLGEASGVTDEFDEEDREGAFYRATDLYREDRQQKGVLDQDAADSDWEDLKQADESGAIDRMVPGASKMAQERALKGPRQPMPAEEEETA